MGFAWFVSFFIGCLIIQTYLWNIFVRIYFQHFYIPDFSAAIPFSSYVFSLLIFIYLVCDFDALQKIKLYHWDVGCSAATFTFLNFVSLFLVFSEQMELLFLYWLAQDRESEQNNIPCLCQAFCWPPKAHMHGCFRLCMCLNLAVWHQ